VVPLVVAVVVQPVGSAWVVGPAGHMAVFVLAQVALVVDNTACMYSSTIGRTAEYNSTDSYIWGN
jgi:hypothetical protein